MDRRPCIGRLAKHGDVEDLESGDPMRLMPRLRQIHKIGTLTHAGTEDLDANTATPSGSQVRQSQRHDKARRPEPGFGYRADEGKKGGDWAEVQEAPGYLSDIPKTSNFLGELYPNAGEFRNELPRLGKVKTAEPPPPKGVSVEEWDRRLQRMKPGRLKTKTAAGLLPNLMERRDVNVALHSIQDQHYLEQMGQPGGETDEDIPLELLTMAGGGVAQGAQMARMARSLEAKANARLARRAVGEGRPSGPIAQRGVPGRLLGPPVEKRAYRLQGKTEVQGIPISIENRRGSVRRGKDGDGNEWETKMKHPYGYIRGTRGADGEPVDAYVGPDKEAPEAFVVHQRDKETGEYDEDKVMLGFRSKREAKEAFLAHYDSPKFLGPISRVSVERLRELIQSKRKLVKISHVSWMALLQEICALEKAAAIRSEQLSGERSRLVRRAGPGIGGLIGAGVGAALGARRGSRFVEL